MSLDDLKSSIEKAIAAAQASGKTISITIEAAKEILAICEGTQKLIKLMEFNIEDLRRECLGKHGKPA